MSEFLRAGILGAIVGDALGVPYEFKSRDQIARAPATDMIGYGTHHQPPGTFSDDGSLMLCTLEALVEGYDLGAIANNFVRWRNDGYWTAHGTVFDIGITTSAVIDRLEDGADPRYSGEVEELTNGNGSLMRILPMAYLLLKSDDIDERFEKVAAVSAISHAHVRSKLCCFYYTELVRRLLRGDDKFDAVGTVNQLFSAMLETRSIDAYETKNYTRLLSGKLHELPRDEVQSSGYVLHTLEASIWCLLNSEAYSEAVLKAVNLGDDTDTTAIVTGGLAGIVFGLESIPEDWIAQIARLDDIVALLDKFDARLNLH